MKYFDSTGLEIEILETDGGHEEAFLTQAKYVDLDKEMPDSEMEYLQERYAEEISMMEYEKHIGAAEARFEGDR